MKTETINGVRVACYFDAKGEANGGFDNWVAVYVDEPETKPNTFACVGLSGHAAAMLGRHLGKRVPFAELPDGLRATVLRDCEEIAKVAPVRRCMFECGMPAASGDIYCADCRSGIEH